MLNSNYRIAWKNLVKNNTGYGISLLTYKHAIDWTNTLNKTHKGNIIHWIEMREPMYHICRLVIKENIVQKGFYEYRLSEAKHAIHYLNYRYKNYMVHWFIPVEVASYHSSSY